MTAPETPTQRLDHMLTHAETAERLRITPDTLYRWRRRNLGPRCTRFGQGRGVVRYRESDVEAYLAASSAA